MKTGRLKTTNEEVLIIETKEDFVEFHLEYQNRFDAMMIKNYVETEENTAFMTKYFQKMWEDTKPEPVVILAKVFQTTPLCKPTVINTDKENIILTG